LNSKVVNFTNPDGKKMQNVIVRWKNTGNSAIRVIDAYITHWARSREMLGKYNYTIFAVSDDAPGVNPSETGTTDGFILPGFQGMPGYKRSTRADVQITNVQQHSGF
jgi:hypothetical protein